MNREQLLQELSKTADEHFCYSIKEIYENCIAEEDNFLKKWQKVQLAGAIFAYNIGWYNLCRFRAELALVLKDDISDEKFTIDAINKEAEMIQDDELLKAIISICHRNNHS